MSGVHDLSPFETIAARVRFVLVEPSHPGNVGAAARAVKTMGFGELVLVHPRHATVREEPEAIAMASGADDVLAAARIVDDLDAALAGVQWSLALSARPREYGPPLLGPREAGAQGAAVAAQGGGVALVFGNERTGLANHDVERCRAIAHIPANPAYSSLNLAQAVQVLAYEMRLACLDAARLSASAPATPGLPGSAGAESDAGASAEDIAGMFGHLEAALVRLDFLDPANPKKLMSRLRQLFARTALTREEVNIFRGIAKHVLARCRDDRQ
ncbi:MAG: RNA methyltransferase [Janthinobacterium lividum]